MWDKITLLSDAEEIINNTYSVKSEFGIFNNVKSTQKPTVNAVYQNQKIIFAIENNLILIEDERKLTEYNLVSFDKSIDCLTVSSDGNLVICAVSDGNIYGIHISGTVIFHLTIDCSDINSMGRSFIGIKHVKDAYYLQCWNGKLYKITEIDSKHLFEINPKTENSQLSINETLLNNVSLELELSLKLKYGSDRASFEMFTFNNSIFSIVAENNLVIISHKNSNSTHIELPSDVQIENILNLDNYILVFTQKGTIFDVCPHTCQYTEIPTPANEKILNAITIEKGDQQIELLLLVRNTESQKTTMKVIDFPSWNCRYEIPVPDNTWIINQPELSANMYYLYGKCSEVDEFESIQLRVVSEIQPENTLKTLIQRGLLEEAEKLAVEFNLSKQPIYEARARNYLLEISLIPQDDTELLQKRFDGFFSVAKLIENKEFLLKLRNMQIADRNVFKRILEFLDGNIDFDRYMFDRDEIKEQLIRIETLSMIDPFECNDNWQTFINHMQLIDVCFTYFKSDISIACLILKQHASSIIPFMNEKKILQVLNAIPQKTLPFDIIQWLRHYVPLITKSHSKALPIVTEWVIVKIKSLQHSTHWPQNGLDFCQDALNIFSNIEFVFPDSERQHDVNIEKLKEISNALEDLAVLKTKFNLTLTLDDYMQNSIDESAFNILCRVSLNNLTNLVNNFLFSIYNEKGQSLLPTIIRYIDHLVKCRKSISMWLERCVECIPLICEEKKKITCAVNVLKAAPVPWPPVVEPLVKLSFSSDPAASEILGAHQMQTIKILRTKYGWPENAPSTANLKFVYRMVKINDDNLIDDLRVFIEYDKSLRERAYLYAIHELTILGHLDTAMRMLDGIDEMDLSSICSNLSSVVAQSIENDIDNPETFNAMMQLMQHLANKNTDVRSRTLINALKKIQTVRQSFNMRIQLSTLQEPNAVKECVEQGLKYTMIKLKQSPNDFMKIAWRNITTLADVLNLEIIQIVTKFCEQINNVRLTSALAKRILDLCTVTDKNADDYINLAVLLLTQQSGILDETKCDVNFHSMAYPLAHRLLLQVERIDLKYYLPIRDLLKWSQFGNAIFTFEQFDEYLKNDDELDANTIERIIEDDDAEIIQQNGMERRNSLSVFEQIKEINSSPIVPTSKPNAALKCLALALSSIVNDLTADTLFTQRFRKYTIPKISNHRGNLFSSLDQLIRAKQHILAFQIIQFIRVAQHTSNQIIISNDGVSQLTRKLLKLIIMQKEVNFDSLIPILMTDPSSDDTLDLLERELKSGQAKVNYLTFVQKYVAFTSQDESRLLAERQACLSYRYYLEFCQIDPQLKNDTNFKITTAESLFRDLNSKVVDVDLLHRMCKDLNWNLDKVLILQIETILEMQKPDFAVVKDPLGKEKIVMKMIPHKVVALCEPYYNSLEEFELLANKLLRFIETINSYFYELFLAVIGILQAINQLPSAMEQWIKILEFLKLHMVTRRDNYIGQTESDWWLKEQAENGILPQIANYRFPFMKLLKEDIKTVLDPEVNVDNCEKWFPLVKLCAPLKNLSSNAVHQTQDALAMTALKSSIQNYKSIKQENGSSTWNLQPINNAFLQSVLNLVSHMHDKKRILFMLYFMSNSAPAGADQVEAARECYLFARANEEELKNDQRAKENVIKIYRKYPMYRIQHLLHVYGLDEDRFFQLVESPKELITVLYHHESVTKADSKIDINQVGAEVAKLHNIDFFQFQMGLLEKWLSFAPEDDANPNDQTFFDDMNASMFGTNAAEMSDDLTARAYYILKSWDLTASTTFLVGHVSVLEENEGSSTGRQLQVIECLIRLVTDGDDNTYHNMVSTPQYIALKCVHNLKQFGFKFTVEKFINYDKLKILKQIWVGHSTNPKALDAISYICIGYNIYEPIIWNNLLKQMVNYQMLKELTTIIEIIATKSPLVHLPGLKAAWEYIIRVPLKNISRVRSEAQDAALCKILFDLQSCPVKSKMNLLDMTETCVRAGQIHIGAVFVALASKEQKSQIAELIKMKEYPTLKEEILELETYGIYAIVLKSAVRELKL